MELCLTWHLKRTARSVQVLLRVLNGCRSELVVLILLPYWVAPYLIAAGYTVAPSIPVMCLCVLLHTVGVVIMMISGIAGSVVGNRCPKAFHTSVQERAHY